MKLMFAISREGSDEVDRLTSTEKEILAGSAASAAIKLDKQPEKVFTVARLDDGVMVLERNDSDVSIKVDGDELTKDSVHVRNGTEIDVGDYKILLTVSFDRASYSTRNSLAVILLFEALIVHWLPRKIHSSELWGSEVLRQSTLLSLDKLRGQILEGISKAEAPSQTHVFKLYKTEADKLAMYTRENQSKLSIEQLKRLDQDIKRLRKQVDLLVDKQLIPPPRTLDAKPAIDALLNEKED